MQFVTIYKVNAFSEQLFRGNPAGVCITKRSLPETLMKNIAMEMAVSETAFVSLNEMSLRWFTPVKEVSLCGHATLAAAYVLFRLKEFNTASPISFQTVSGPLTVRYVDGFIAMDFPRIDVARQEAGRDLLDALGLDGDDIVFSGRAGRKQLLHVRNEGVLNNVSPDFSSLMQLSGRGIIMTSSSEETKYDFVSRYFAPWVGVNEDPVTGSAHCVLAPYWYLRGAKSKMIAHQNSARGGEVFMELLETGVTISGKAVLALEGQLVIER